MQRIKDLAYKFWNSEGRRVFHAAWQAAGGVLLAGLIAAHSTADVKLAVGAAATTALAAVKAILVAPRG